MAVPAPPVSQKSSSNFLIIGCAIGCGGLLLLGVIVAVAGFFVVKKGIDIGLEQAARELPAEAEKELAKAKEEGYLPAEHAERFDEMLAASKAEGSSPYVRVGSAILVIYPLDDKEVSASEIEVLTTFSTFFKENPQAGLLDCIRFIERHPELEGAFKEIQSRIEQRASQAPAVVE